MTQSFDEWYFDAKKHNADGFTNREFHEAGAQSRQAEVDELQKRIDVCEKLRDSQFEKLWGLTQAIDIARDGADEDFDMFLNHLSNILKGEQNDN